MPSTSLKIIKDKIAAKHEGDDKQLEVIFSDTSRLMVEAPAGYGKTTTMISRLAYLFATGKIPNPKRILGLTFSVNAALKVKREVAEKLPALLGSHNSSLAISEKATITNYHGFCKGILKKYGYLIADALRKDINLFRAVGDTEIEKLAPLKAVLTSNESMHLKEVDAIIKEAHIPNSEEIHLYNSIVIKKLLPLGYITHTAIILFVLELFESNAEVANFYQSLYPIIVVDEFQDTNCIAWSLLETIISDQTQLLFLGDPLQRIYGFIGALPDIMSIASEKYNMTRITLSKNYRFRDNTEMLKLDRNIRANATSYFAPAIPEDDLASLPGFWGKTQQDEADQITSKVQDLLKEKNSKIALLFRSRGKNSEKVEEQLIIKKIPYFYGMFTDEDLDYIEFHNKCHAVFINRFESNKSINKRSLTSFSNETKKQYAEKQDKIVYSLLRLLDAFVEKVAIDYADLLPEDKYMLLLDVFENRQLKQAMEYVDSQVILSTVHGAKGLEWDYVILGDIERWVFPSYYICKACESRFNQPNKGCCILPSPLPKEFRDLVLDELSVFYVGITRAKKQIYVSASSKRLDSFGNEKDSVYSCMVRMPGVKLVKANSF